MKITIDLELNIHKHLAILYNFINWFNFNSSWLGYTIAVFHLMLTGVLIVLIFISHTVYRLFTLKVIVFLILGAILLQHVIFNVCVMAVYEKILTKTHSPFHELVEKFLKSFGLSFDDYDKYLIITESVTVGCLGLEIISEGLDKIASYDITS